VDSVPVKLSFDLNRASQTRPHVATLQRQQQADMFEKFFMNQRLLQIACGSNTLSHYELPSYLVVPSSAIVLVPHPAYRNKVLDAAINYFKFAST